MLNHIIYMGTAIALLSIWIDVKLAVILVFLLYLFFKNYIVVNKTSGHVVQDFDELRKQVEAELEKKQRQEQHDDDGDYDDDDENDNSDSGDQNETSSVSKDSQAVNE
jgi:Sec-independent protein translocase protein TatA